MTPRFLQIVEAKSFRLSNFYCVLRCICGGRRPGNEATSVLQGVFFPPCAISHQYHAAAINGGCTMCMCMYTCSHYYIHVHVHVQYIHVCILYVSHSMYHTMSIYTCTMVEWVDQSNNAWSIIRCSVNHSCD